MADRDYYQQQSPAWQQYTLPATTVPPPGHLAASSSHHAHYAPSTSPLMPASYPSTYTFPPLQAYASTPSGGSYTTRGGLTPLLSVVPSASTNLGPPGGAASSTFGSQSSLHSSSSGLASGISRSNSFGNNPPGSYYDSHPGHQHPMHHHPQDLPSLHPHPSHHHPSQSFSSSHQQHQDSSSHGGLLYLPDGYVPLVYPDNQGSTSGQRGGPSGNLSGAGGPSSGGGSGGPGMDLTSGRYYMGAGSSNAGSSSITVNNLLSPNIAVPSYHSSSSINSAHSGGGSGPGNRSRASFDSSYSYALPRNSEHLPFPSTSSILSGVHSSFPVSPLLTSHGHLRGSSQASSQNPYNSMLTSSNDRPSDSSQQDLHSYSPSSSSYHHSHPHHHPQQQHHHHQQQPPSPLLSLHPHDHSHHHLNPHQQDHQSRQHHSNQSPHPEPPPHHYSQSPSSSSRHREPTPLYDRLEVGTQNSRLGNAPRGHLPGNSYGPGGYTINDLRPRGPSTSNNSDQHANNGTGSNSNDASKQVKTAKRPANSWILYRQEKHPIVLAQREGITNNEISKIVAEMWKTEPEHKKNVYKTRAEEERRRHRLLHPDYKYAPRKNKPKRRKRKVASATSALPPSASSSARANAPSSRPPATTSSTAASGERENLSRRTEYGLTLGSTDSHGWGSTKKVNESQNSPAGEPHSAPATFGDHVPPWMDSEGSDSGGDGQPSASTRGSFDLKFWGPQQNPQPEQQQEMSAGDASKRDKLPVPDPVPQNRSQAPYLYETTTGYQSGMFGAPEFTFESLGFPIAGVEGTTSTDFSAQNTRQNEDASLGAARESERNGDSDDNSASAMVKSRNSSQGPASDAGSSRMIAAVSAPRTDSFPHRLSSEPLAMDDDDDDDDETGNVREKLEAVIMRRRPSDADSTPSTDDPQLRGSTASSRFKYSSRLPFEGRSLSYDETNTLENMETSEGIRSIPDAPDPLLAAGLSTFIPVELSNVDKIPLAVPEAEEETTDGMLGSS